MSGRYRRNKKHEESNYSAVFNQGETIRFKIEQSKPILPLRFPELEDVSISSRCLANCPYCYTDAKKTGDDHINVVDKIYDYYGGLSENDRPFQVAIGGEGEPTLHPHFIEVLRAFSELNIMPNYTTNGMHLSQEIVNASVEYCGGVAVSTHPHLEKVWREAIPILRQVKTLCLHIIVGQRKSNAAFWRLVEQYPDVNTFVCLPYQTVGRAQYEIWRDQEFEKFFGTLRKRNPPNVAIGALFYPIIKKNPELIKGVDLAIYEPDIFSGYRIMNSTYRMLRKSSYEPHLKFFD